MTQYAYSAVSGSGRMINGGLDAESLDQANKTLGERGLSTVTLREDKNKPTTEGQRAYSARMPMGSVSAEELILITKQLATMLRAGIPMLRVFDVLESQSETPKLKAICADIGLSIRGGSPLHRALRRHPHVFSPLYCGMVMAGETSGALPQVLQRLIYVISHEHKVKTEVRSVMQYPILVLVCLIAAFILLIVYVVPRFAAVYTRSAIELPWPTRACMFMSDLFRNQAGWLIGGMALLVLAYYAAMRTPQGRYARDYLFLHLPLIGPLMIKAALSRLSSIFAILQATGVGILDSLTILKQTIGNAALGRELGKVQTELEAGRGIARPLSTAKYFTPLFINMVAVGEEAGNLDEMLNEISLHYDAEVEFATRRLTTAMGPILIVCLAAMVGFFALAVYLPMWDLARMVSSNP